MYHKRFLVIALTTLITTSIQPFGVAGILPIQQVSAQTVDTRNAEADRLVQQGINQLEANQLKAGLQSFQKSLIIYRDTKNRKGEGVSLIGLGIIYSQSQNYSKAIDYYKQSLVIAREIQDSELEAVDRKRLAKDTEISKKAQNEKANRLINQGLELSAKGRFQAALTFCE